MYYFIDTGRWILLAFDRARPAVSQFVSSLYFKLNKQTSGYSFIFSKNFVQETDRFNSV